MVVRIYTAVIHKEDDIYILERMGFVLRQKRPPKYTGR